MDDARKITKEDAIRVLEDVKNICEYNLNKSPSAEYLGQVAKDIFDLRIKAFDMAIKALEQKPCDDMVSRGVFEQVMWERDVAISQLKELGYEFGEKIEPCEDCISRQAVLDLAKKGVLVSNGNYESVCKAINEIPSVNPTKTGHREYNDIYDHYLCGNCKTVVMDYDNYCPNCGARMESEG